MIESISPCVQFSKDLVFIMVNADVNKMLVEVILSHLLSRQENNMTAKILKSEGYFIRA